VADEPGVTGDTGARDRLHAVLGGERGIVSVGVTFLPKAATASLLWGGEADAQTPLAVAVCSRLAPDFAFVPVWEPAAETTVRDIASCGTAPFVVVRGLLTSIAEEDGWVPTLRATLTGEGDFACRLDVATSVAIADAKMAADWGAFAVVVAEDVAGATGPLVAPDYVIGDLMPRLGRIASAAHDAGLAAVWHSDGDIRAGLRAATRAGFDAVQPAGLEPHAFEAVLAEARRHGLTVLGGIPCATIRTGGPAAIRAGVEAAVTATVGGLLVSDDGSIAAGPELAALISALQAARDPSTPGG